MVASETSCRGPELVQLLVLTPVVVLDKFSTGAVARGGDHGDEPRTAGTYLQGP